ncbi:hypothetical protein [Paracraurococcus lichenis]|uniref:Uncharacterized protein n=1 Tax=Paracraurococcus lichenis TaxID=3064888 RepID=A0ABT9DWN9_9PROT|nr:hypothetical protein [Paracraurococcus sp. LOR1-02]MDO9708322.1 hypothetical protein [Paracraurococcus sp. LOR1-02]
MPGPIRVARTPAGALTYAVPIPPERLPAVEAADLLAAWSLARRAAGLELWGPPRLLRFARPDGEATEIAIADADAGCWAEAVDAGYGLATLPGLALCLRLLALVEVLGRVPALAPLFDVGPDGIDLHPALLDAAARLPLDAGARFDEAAIRRLLSDRLPPRADRRRIA